MTEIYVVCPHCDQQILIMSNEINCAIFRHGAFKDTGSQVNPHETKEICDKLFDSNAVHGCCKPFKLVQNENNYVAEICDYV